MTVLRPAGAGGRVWRVLVCSWPGIEGETWSKGKGGWSLWREMYDIGQSVLGPQRAHDFPTFILTLDFGHAHRMLMRIEIVFDPDDEGGSILGLSRIQSPFGPNEQGQIRWFVELCRAERDLEPSSWSKPTKRLCLQIRSAEPVPGRLVLSDEDVEIYRLLGEPLPFLWDDDRFLSWVDSRVDG